MHAMQRLYPAGNDASGWTDMGWFRHVVRPLLRGAGAQCPTIACGPGSHAVLHRPLPGRTYAGGCFASTEGHGCELSADEQRIAKWVGYEPASWEV